MSTDGASAVAGERRWVAFLRAVNVGDRVVPMAELTSLAEGLGLRGVRTWLRSGNVVFRDGERSPSSALERRFEVAAERQLGLTTEVLVRSAEELEKVLSSGPFPAFARTDPSHLLVVLLKAPPQKERVLALASSISGQEEVRAGPRCLYATYPEGVGRSRLTLSRIESALGTRGTARNWNTLSRLLEMARED